MFEKHSFIDLKKLLEIQQQLKDHSHPDLQTPKAIAMMWRGLRDHPEKTQKGFRNTPQITEQQLKAFYDQCEASYLELGGKPGTFPSFDASGWDFIDPTPKE